MSKSAEFEDIQANLVVRSIDERDAMFFRGVSTLVSDFFDSADIASMTDTGLILLASEKPFYTSELIEQVRSLDEPLTAMYDTVALRRYARGGLQLTMQFKSDQLYDEVTAIAKNEGMPINLPAAAKMTLATIIPNIESEQPIFDINPINAKLIETGILDTPVTFAPAHYF